MFKAWKRLVPAALICASVPALAMSVQPVVIDLKLLGSGSSQTISVENSFSGQLPVELKVTELNFSADGLVTTGKESTDLLVFPPQSIIPPGQTQNFRVQYVGDPDIKKSKHYYVTVAQLPIKLPDGQSGVQILYNFQVLVSIAPLGVAPQLKVTGARVGKDDKGKPVPEITFNNGSAAHGYVSAGRLRIIMRDAAGKEIFRKQLSGPEIQQTVGFGLIGAEQTRTIKVPLELPAAEGSIDAQFTSQG
ncbi:MAG: pilus assembly protein PapD [Proteobacteria bacterium SG_bin5]|nr:fimbria/pilus periplasmic chaperone [Sphingomonas sp.]OQW41155.1 MAG: pilus assembly protein PapD [Proteobacteria bacterium SG_bin5]